MQQEALTFTTRSSDGYIRYPIAFLTRVSGIWDDWKAKLDQIHGKEEVVPLCSLNEYPDLFRSKPSARLADCLTIPGRIAWTKLLARAIDDGKMIDLIYDANGVPWVVGAQFGSRSFHN